MVAVVGEGGTAEREGSVAMVFPAGVANAVKCEHWSGVFEGGEYDLSCHPEFGPLLEELRSVDWPAHLAPGG